MNRIVIVGGGGTSISMEVIKRLIDEGMEVIEADVHRGVDPKNLTVFGIGREDALSKIDIQYIPELHEPIFPTFLPSKEKRHKAQWKVETRGRKQK